MDRQTDWLTDGRIDDDVHNITVFFLKNMPIYKGITIMTVFQVLLKIYGL